MADTKLPKNIEDPKAARAKLKADKKEYRKNLKEQRKERKAKENEFAERSEEIYGDNAGGFATIAITLIIILIWLAIMALLIKLDVGGFGSDVLAPLIKDVPYLNLILPEGSYEKKKPEVTEITVDTTVDGTVTGDTGSITTLEDANAYIKRLEKALQSEMEENSAYAAQIEKLEAEVARLEPFERQQKEFYEQREQFYNEIVYGENTPDPTVFQQYYEMIDPDTAASIYQKVVQGGVDDAAISAFASTYSGMKAKSAAAIFDEMVNENQIELVSKILAKMTTEQRSDILAAMDKPNAAKLTQMLQPDAMDKESSKITGSN